VISVASVEGAADAGDDIRDIGKVAASAAVTVDGNRLSLVDGAGELVDRHLRTLARTVYGEKPKARDLHLEEVMVSVAEKLTGLFGGGVGRDGMIDVVSFAEGLRRAHAVYRRG